MTFLFHSFSLSNLGKCSSQGIFKSRQEQKKEHDKLRRLRSNVGYVNPWVRGSNFYVGYVGQNNFHVGQHIKRVIICTWVARIKYVFAWVKKKHVESNILGLRSTQRTKAYVVEATAQRCSAKKVS